LYGFSPIQIIRDNADASAFFPKNMMGRCETPGKLLGEDTLYTTTLLGAQSPLEKKPNPIG